MVGVVHDNASNVKKIGRLSLETDDVGCAAHTLQLSINKGFNDVPAVKRLIGAANRLVNHFKHSTIATKALEAKQTDMNKPKKRLISSCKTRWNSVCDMMRRLEECRWPICAVLSDPTYTSDADARVLEMDDANWKLMHELIVCLKPLKVY